MLHRRISQCAIIITLMGTPAAHAESRTNYDKDVKDLADRIDHHIAAGWHDNKVKPADAADDATYLRRVYLDVVGQIPAIYEARDFLDDHSADKRQRLVERLLETDAYARHFGNVLRRALLPGNLTSPERNHELEIWFQERLQDNVGYDVMARSILTGDPKAVPYRAFADANANKPEELASATSRFFWGVRIECAQCHKHPFAKWKKEQFWEFAAYFSGGQATIPNTDTTVKARLLIGDAPEVRDPESLRKVLAQQLTTSDNPYFARAAVNRLWLQFFGIGLVDPVDALGEDQPPSHPEVLDELARAFVEHKYDLRLLICAITSTKTYALSSISTDASQDDPRRFARAAVRGLTAEELYDSIGVATGRVIPLRRGTGKSISKEAQAARAEFSRRFNQSGTPLEIEASLLQALYLMNSQAMSSAISLQENHLLQTIAGSENQTTAQRIEDLYLLVLSRRPRPEESTKLAKFVDDSGRRGASKALADVYWALLNSPEFSLNH
jgi:hypothetical protein